MAGLKDIAQLTGVSIRTVSRALRGNGYVRPEIREKVVACARELGYHPNLAARSLVTKKSYVIAILTGSCLDALDVAKIEAFQQRVMHDGYSATVYFESENNAETIIDNVLSRRPAGVAMLRCVDPEQAAAAFAERQTPCVAMDYRKGEHIAGVYIDRQQGVYEAVKYLAASGRKRIAYLGSTQDNTRLQGYERAMRELGLKPIIISLAERYADSYFATGRAAAKRLTEHPDRPDAVQVYADFLALGVLAGLHDLGCRVPQHLAVIGFDDRDAASYGWPPLTTVAQPNREVGNAAAEMLLELIRTGTAPSTRVSLPTKLVIREST